MADHDRCADVCVHGEPTACPRVREWLTVRGDHDAEDALLGGWLDESRCPACGDPIDYCQGHGEIGDMRGHNILAAHDEGDHADCHPDGCVYASVR